MREVMPGRGIQLQGAVTAEQFLHRHGVIHPGAVARENASFGIDIQAVLAVQGFDVGIAERLRGVFRHRLDDAPIEPRKLELLVSRDSHPVSAFPPEGARVHQAMSEGHWRSVAYNQIRVQRGSCAIIRI